MEHIILLHGALSSKTQMLPLKEKLSTTFIVHTPDFPGHGGAGIPETGFSIESFAKFLITYIENNKIENPLLFGYSMGGYVAIYLAPSYPGKIKQVMTLGTKYLWDETIAAAEVKLMDPITIEKKVPQFAAELKERHQANWQLVLNSTAEMLTRMGIHSPLQMAHFNRIDIPCLLLQGDRDKMVPLAETMAVYKQIPNAQLGVLPGGPHAFEKINLDILSNMIIQFAGTSVHP